MTITVSGSVITFSDSTTQSTAASAGVTSLNGQTGAITDTTFNTIGSYTVGAALVNGGSYPVGTTVAGTSIYQRGDTGTNVFTGFVSNTPGIANQGQTGTWRAMAKALNTSTTSKSPTYFAISTLWVRVS